MINGIKEPAFWMGVVEDRRDPLKIGRVRARVIGLHTHDKTILPTADLPWAYCIQPVNSAAISGIGVAPVGPLEGTWVAIQYLDQDRQSAFVVGTLPGIASADGTFFGEAPSQGGGYEVKPDGTVTAPWLDYGDVPVGDGKFNLCGTYVTSKNMINEIKASEAFRAKPYKDVGGIWTIGYGTTYIERIPVSASTPEVDAGRAEELLRIDVKKFENAIKSVVLASVTQSMFDAMVSLCYNIGPSAFRQSTVQQEVNAKNYAGAAEAFMMWDKVNKKPDAGLTARRQKEKAWFLREGVGGAASAAGATRPVGAMATASSTARAATGGGSGLQKILSFGSASGIVLSKEEIGSIVASVPVKMLTKEEYVANISAPPGIYTVSPGGGGGGGSDGGVQRVVLVEVSHSGLFEFDAATLAAFKRMPFLLHNPERYKIAAHTEPTMTRNGVTVRDDAGVARRSGVKIGGMGNADMPYPLWFLSPLVVKIKGDFTTEMHRLAAPAGKQTITSDILSWGKSGGKLLDKTIPLPYPDMFGYQGAEFWCDISKIIGQWGSHDGRGAIVDDTFSTPAMPSCTIMLNFGNLFYQQRIREGQDEFIEPGEQVAENAWIRITIPIDTKNFKKNT